MICKICHSVESNASVCDNCHSFLLEFKHAIVSGTSEKEKELLKKIESYYFNSSSDK